MNSKKKGMSLLGKQRAAGWTFLAPATIMIAIMSFYPMIRAFIISLQTGAGANMRGFTGRQGGRGNRETYKYDHPRTGFCFLSLYGGYPDRGSGEDLPYQ